MRIYLIVDLEGVSGVVSYEQTNPAGKEYSFGLRMLKSDLDALCSGIFAHGDHRVVVYDMHFYGRNIDLASLDSRVEVICGKPLLPDAFFLEKKFDCLFLLGFHSRVENSDGLLHHSYEDDIKAISANGKSIGEIGLETAIAGELSMPLGMLTGDSEGIREARELLGDIPSVTVKESQGESSGLCYSAAETARRIQETAPVALERIARENPRPFIFPAPIKLEISLRKGKILSALKKIAPKEFVSPDRMLFEESSLRAAWRNYRELLEKTT